PPAGPHGPARDRPRRTDRLDQAVPLTGTAAPRPVVAPLPAPPRPPTRGPAPGRRSTAAPRPRRPATGRSHLRPLADGARPAPARRRRAVGPHHRADGQPARRGRV